MNKEYRIWLINELRLTDTDQLSTYDLEKRFEAIGCLRPQSTHTERNKFLLTARELLD